MPVPSETSRWRSPVARPSSRRSACGARAPGLELVHRGGVQAEAAGEREGAAAGQPDAARRQALDFEGEIVRWRRLGRAGSRPAPPPRDGELRERRPDIDADPDRAAGRAGLGAGGWGGTAIGISWLDFGRWSTDDVYRVLRLREKPFALTPDPRFLFLASSHREALAHVLYGIEQGEGFIAVTGEVGTGKTTLCRTLLERLGRETEVAFVFNPMLSGEDLLRAINTEFGLFTEGCTRAELSDQLNQFLLEQKRARRRVLLIVDEAQNLAPETLEEIRLLSNLETSTSKLIQILLFGQPELDEKLDSNELRQLRQRISVRWSLGSLTPAETREYVRHRLRIAAEGGSRDLLPARALARCTGARGGFRAW